MRAFNRLALISLLAIGFLASAALADEPAGFDNGIKPGTIITMQNWDQYKQFMPPGMVALFQGTYFWKMPSDVEMPVGPTLIRPLPKDYIDATEKYGSQTQVVHYPDGSMSINNFVAGQPFPNPQEPDKGYKILADIWYPPAPHLLVLPSSTPASFCTVDRFGSSACTKTSVVYRQLAYNWAPGVPRVEKEGGGAWYSEWLMVEQPEQSRYTADLTLLWQDLTKPDDDYVFVPALRRSLRLSTAARCAPLFGSDMTHDDQRGGYNGGLNIFNAVAAPDTKMLAITDLTNADGAFPAEYDMPLGWSKPSWGPWSVRDVYVINVKRIPSQREGYCYGNRTMYVDKQLLHQLWLELYDSNNKLWKIVSVHLHPQAWPPYGVQGLNGSLIEQYWDVQNEHVSHIFTAFSDGKTNGLIYDSQVPAEYNNIMKYSTPGGLMQIMR